VLNAVKESNPEAVIIPLSQNFEMVVKDHVLALVKSSETPVPELSREFVRITPAFVQLATSLSHHTAIAYVENECFGGPCDQYAIVWEAGEIIYGPEFVENDIGPVSNALRVLGVRKDEEDPDEFNALELYKHRSNSSWLREYGNLDL